MPFRLRLPLAVAFALLATADIADADIKPATGSRSASDLAFALSSQRGLVKQASFSSLPPFSRPASISTTPLAGFPAPSARSSGGRFAILGTGDTTLASRANNSTFTGREAGGPSIRGAYDVTIVRVDLRVPRGARCLELDVRLLSDEYKEAVGTGYSDTFIAELGTSNWKVTGLPNPTISAPFNFARSAAGELMTITKTGFSAMTPAAARGTTYDGATRRIRASTAVKPGRRILYLSIFDRGDRVYDSAAFVDNLRTTRAKTCSTRVAGR
jgi:hypothetical protein